MNLDETTMTHILLMAGWRQDAPFPKLWHRPGEASYTDTETAFKIQLAMPETARAAKAVLIPQTLEKAGVKP